MNARVVGNMNKNTCDDERTKHEMVWAG
jgi:hypothetical protein